MLIPGGEATEVCQYYAFFFRVADRARHPQLYHRLLDEFSPASRAAGAHPQIAPANAFIGNYLRLELLSQAGRSRQIMEEIKTFFAPMAALTGTLWEHMGPCASCDHGFASHAACSLIRDVLGLRRTGVNSLLLHIPDLPLEHCRVVLPLPEGPLEVAGRRSGSAVSPRICLPRGYTIQIAADPCLTVVRKEILPC